MLQPWFLLRMQMFSIFICQFLFITSESAIFFINFSSFSYNKLKLYTGPQKGGESVIR